ncbi:MAG: DUF2490 domain-containing protein [Bacteroidota bacterium]
MGPLKFFLVVFFSTLLVTPLFSQVDIENNYGSWFVISGANSIHENWSIPTVGILRHHGMWENYEFGFFRTGINYQKNKKVQFGIGGAFLNSKHYLPEENFEVGNQYWFYQECTIKSQLHYATFTQRFRLENRWIHREETVNFNARIRCRFQFTKNLNKRIYIKVFDELFVNINDDFFNQNRFYVGIGSKVSKNISVDIGYLKNHFSTAQNDVVRMGLNFKTSMLSRKESITKIDNTTNGIKAD